MAARRSRQAPKDDVAAAVPAAAFAGFDPALTGGITYAGINPSAAALLRAEEELFTIRCIVDREDIVAKLRCLFRQLERRFDVSQEALDLLQAARDATVTVCENISAWKRQFVSVRCGGVEARLGVPWVRVGVRAAVWRVCESVWMRMHAGGRVIGRVWACVGV
jgi:hypothetical protein